MLEFLFELLFELVIQVFGQLLLEIGLHAIAARAVQRRLSAGELDLLYVAPERLLEPNPPDAAVRRFGRVGDAIEQQVARGIAGMAAASGPRLRPESMVRTRFS